MPRKKRYDAMRDRRRRYKGEIHATGGQARVHVLMLAPLQLARCFMDTIQSLPGAGRTLGFHTGLAECNETKWFHRCTA
jgi:hypothetical protein